MFMLPILGDLAALLNIIITHDIHQTQKTSADQKFIDRVQLPRATPNHLEILLQLQIGRSAAEKVALALVPSTQLPSRLDSIKH